MVHARSPYTQSLSHSSWEMEAPGPDGFMLVLQRLVAWRRLSDTGYTVDSA